jgi:hypothetical protein
MASSTAKYVIPYAQLADTVASLAQTTQDLASRVDLLLGESGSFNIASAAGGVAGAQAVALARVYPGNSGAAVPGIVIPDLVATYAANNRFNWWIDTWTGSGTTITGFTFRYIWETAQTNRVVNWRFLPVL